MNEIQRQVKNIASKGRYGDSMLMHVNPAEVRGLASAMPLTVNPQTGQPEAFLPFLAPIIGSMLGPTLFSGMGALGASALGSGLAQWAATGDLKKGLLAGLTGYGLGTAMQGAGAAKAGADATAAATQTATDAATQAALTNPANLGITDPTLLNIASTDPTLASQLGAEALNPAGQLAMQGNLASLQPSIAQAGRTAADAYTGTGVDALKDAFTDNTIGEGFGNLATGLTDPMAYIPAGIGMGGTGIMESQEAFERMLGESEEEYRRRRQQNLLDNPEPILYSAEGGRTGYYEGGRFGELPDNIGGELPQIFAPARQAYQVNPNFMAGFSPETMYFNPATISAPASSLQAGAPSLGVDTYEGSKGGYGGRQAYIAPQTSIDPYAAYTGEAPEGLKFRKGPTPPPIFEKPQLPDIGIPEIGLPDYGGGINIPNIGNIDLSNIDFSGMDFESLVNQYENGIFDSRNILDQFNIPEKEIGVGAGFDEVNNNFVPITGDDLGLGENFNDLGFTPNIDIPEITQAQIAQAQMAAPEVDLSQINIPEVSIPQLAQNQINIPEVGASLMTESELALPQINIPQTNEPDFSAALDYFDSPIQALKQNERGFIPLELEGGFDTNKQPITPPVDMSVEPAMALPRTDLGTGFVPSLALPQAVETPPTGGTPKMDSLFFNPDGTMKMGAGFPGGPPMTGFDPNLGQPPPVGTPPPVETLPPATTMPVGTPPTGGTPIAPSIPLQNVAASGPTLAPASPVAPQLTPQLGPPSVAPTLLPAEDLVPNRRQIPKTASPITATGLPITAPEILPISPAPVEPKEMITSPKEIEKIKQAMPELSVDQNLQQAATDAQLELELAQAQGPVTQGQIQKAKNAAMAANLQKAFAESGGKTFEQEQAELARADQIAKSIAARPAPASVAKKPTRTQPTRRNLRNMINARQGMMASGGVTGFQEGGMADINNDPLTQEVVKFVLGENENEEALNMFIDKYGSEVFMQLRQQVLESIVPDAQTEGLIRGDGEGGMDDDLRGMIGDKERIAVSQDEFIVPADVVSMLGDGSSDAGSKELYNMMDRVRQAKTGGTTQAPRINVNKVLPA